MWSRCTRVQWEQTCFSSSPETRPKCLTNVCNLWTFVIYARLEFTIVCDLRTFVSYERSWFMNDWALVNCAVDFLGIRVSPHLSNRGGMRLNSRCRQLLSKQRPRRRQCSGKTKGLLFVLLLCACVHACIPPLHFFIFSRVLRDYTLLCRPVGWSVIPLFTFSAFLGFLNIRLLPRCPCDLQHCSCSPARD